MNKPLEILTNAELSEVFAREVLGRKTHLGMMSAPDIKCGEMLFEQWVRIPDVANSADAVLPFCTKPRSFEAKYVNEIEQWRVEVWGMIVFEDTFARAACIALITAKRAEKDTAKA